MIGWRSPAEPPDALPRENIGGALRTGLRHARSNSYLMATLIRAVGFFLFGSAYWSLLPVLVRTQIRSGPALYGVTLGAIGIAAVGGTFALPRLRSRWSADRLLIGATGLSSLACVLFAFARDPVTVVVASICAGLSWIVAVSSLNISAQLALPEWVRGRGLALYATAMFGSLSLGGLIWGEVAALASVPTALLGAAAGAVLALFLTRHQRLQSGPGVDFTPAMHWPAPLTLSPVEDDRGPVLVTVEYQIDPQDTAAFLRALYVYGRERRRDGASEWGVFEDPSRHGRFVEVFMSDSWMEHLRQHQRVTRTDRILEDAVRRFQIGGDPKTTHLVAARPDDPRA